MLKDQSLDVIFDVYQSVGIRLFCLYTDVYITIRQSLIPCNRTKNTDFQDTVSFGVILLIYYEACLTQEDPLKREKYLRTYPGTLQEGEACRRH